MKEHTQIQPLPSWAVERLQAAFDQFRRETTAAMALDANGKVIGTVGTNPAEDAILAEGAADRDRPGTKNKDWLMKLTRHVAMVIALALLGEMAPQTQAQSSEPSAPSPDPFRGSPSRPAIPANSRGRYLPGQQKS